MPTPPLASTGIGSGLDVNAIVAKLMSIERRPLDALSQQQATYQSKISAYGALKSALSTLQISVQGLMANGAFRGMAATISDPTVATVAAGSGAVAGTHQMFVTALAQAHRVAAAALAAETDTVGTGTLTFAFGTTSGTTFTPNPSAATGTVVIGAGQSSLAGVRDAVNAANIGVTASIVDTGDVPGKRLVFTSASGAAMSVKITIADGDGNNVDDAGLSRLAYDPAGTAGNGRNLAETMAAQNAALNIDGIAISKPSNVVSDALAGVTLTLNKLVASPGATVTIKPDSAASITAVENFVTRYNELVQLIGNMTKYDPERQAGSILTGDITARTIQSRLRTMTGGTISGTTGEFSSLSSIGIKSAVDGTLTLDSAKLTAVLASDPKGVEQLFSEIGTASDALVTYAGSTAKTQAGDYPLTVTQLATQGKLVGSSAALLVITAGLNDTLTATVDGVSATVTLSPGSYANADALAAEVAGRLNGATALRNAGSSVTVTAAGNVLTATSDRFGSASSVAFSGNARTTLMGVSPTATAGFDVAGTIGGVAAVGSGKTLTGAAGNGAEGLELTIEGGAVGARGTVRFTRGVGALLDALLTDLVDDDGLVAAKTEGAQASITSLDKRKLTLEARLQRVEDAYRRQYIALDATIAQMSAISQYLTQQLENLPKPYDGSR